MMMRTGVNICKVLRTVPGTQPVLCSANKINSLLFPTFVGRILIS